MHARDNALEENIFAKCFNSVATVKIKLLIKFVVFSASKANFYSKDKNEEEGWNIMIIV